MAKKSKRTSQPQRTEVVAWVICGADNLRHMTCRWRSELERVIGRAIRFVYDATKRAAHVICENQAIHQRIGQILAAAGFACQEQKVYIRTGSN